MCTIPAAIGRRCLHYHNLTSLCWLSASQCERIVSRSVHVNQSNVPVWTSVPQCHPIRRRNNLPGKFIIPLNVRRRVVQCECDCQF